MRPSHNHHFGHRRRGSLRLVVGCTSGPQGAGLPRRTGSSPSADRPNRERQDFSRRRHRSGEPKLRQSLSGLSRRRYAIVRLHEHRREDHAAAGRPRHQMGHRPSLRRLLRSLRRQRKASRHALQDGRLRSKRSSPAALNPPVPESEPAIQLRHTERTKPYFAMAQAIRARRPDVHLELRREQFRLAPIFHRRASGKTIDYPTLGDWGCDGGPTDTIWTITQQRALNGKGSGLLRLPNARRRTRHGRTFRGVTTRRRSTMPKAASGTRIRRSITFATDRTGRPTSSLRRRASSKTSPPASCRPSAG